MKNSAKSTLKRSKSFSESKKCPWCKEPCPNPECAWKEEEDEDREDNDNGVS